MFVRGIMEGEEHDDMEADPAEAPSNAELLMDFGAEMHPQEIPASQELLEKIEP